jgi:hypothetical protein
MTVTDRAGNSNTYSFTGGNDTGYYPAGLPGHYDASGFCVAN